jgi:Domain of unknown function (DUF222)
MIKNCPSRGTGKAGDAVSRRISTVRRIVVLCGSRRRRYCQSRPRGSEYETGGCDDPQAALACVDALRESVPSLRGPELLEAVCGIEVLTRKTHAAMLELVAGLDAAKVAGEQGFGTTWRLLSAMLDLSAGQARARVRDAEQLATRRTLIGEVLPAHLPATAAALASSAIGTGQLTVITRTMATLPSTVSQHDRDWAETTLAEHAQNFDQRRLRVIARRIVDQFDPDGPAPAEPQGPRPAAGEPHIRDRRDGGISLEGWLDALHGTAFRGLIEQLAKPRSLAEDIPDPHRSPAQRRRAGRTVRPGSWERPDVNRGW